LTFDIYIVYDIDNVLKISVSRLNMGIIIRVLYNNKDWKSPCTHPGMDTFCHKCFGEGNLDIKRPSKDDEICSGLCWERDLCTNYEWGCTPRGRSFGNRAYKGVRVFFVFQQPEHKYTLWGKTTVDSVNVSPKRQLIDHEIGYDSWMRFVPFEPLPTDKWVRDLRDIDLVDKQWKQGRHRFITPEKEAELERRIEGMTPEQRVSGLDISFPIRDNKVVAITFANNIYKRLVEVGKAEGRQLEEIVKEAIAEWLRARGWLTFPDVKS
jgi:hypothetical protein